MAAKSEANWTEINPAELCDETRGEYEAYKALYRQMKAARQAFEQGMERDTGTPPTGKRLVFGYNFGKLSIAMVDDDRKVAKPKASTVSLADFLKAQQASGRAA